MLREDLLHTTRPQVPTICLVGRMEEKGRRDGGRERGKTRPLHACELNKETRIRKVTRRG